MLTFAKEKTVFSATTTAAGMNMNIKEPSTLVASLLTFGIPKMAALRSPPCKPAKLTSTKETEAKRNVCTFFSATKYPATNPRTISNPVSICVVF